MPEDVDGPPAIESFMMGYERRAARVVAEESMKYTGDGCPMPGCDSKGGYFSFTNACVLCLLLGKRS